VGRLMVKKDIERKELLWRLLVLVISGIILSVWKSLIIVLAILHFIIVLFSGKRDKSLADFCEYWNSETYRYIRYLTFETNERPFPFNPLVKLNNFVK
jgi:hypothetical protein